MTTSDETTVVRGPATPCPVRRFATGVLAAAALILAGCAGSQTPLPDFREGVAKVLTPQQKEAAMAAIEQRRDAVNQATSAIEKDRVVK